jgi:hypothetical protein
MPEAFRTQYYRLMEHFFTKKVVRAAITGVFLLGFATPSSWAWGREGHRLTALVAEAYLTQATKAQIAELLNVKITDKDALADIASWADDYRQGHPETAPWHFVDIPSTEPSYDRKRDCPASSDAASPWRDCAADRILYFEGRLADTSLSLQERAIALKFLVHLIGDVHQPFHAIGDARGGNGINITFLGSNQCGTYKCNLHGVWDESLIEQHRLSEAKYTDLLLNEIKENHWENLAGGSPTIWVNASHKYAVNALAPDGAMLRHDYVEEETKVVDSQLALGGLRLAHVLNHILDSPDTSSPARTPLAKPNEPAPVPQP